MSPSFTSLLTGFEPAAIENGGGTVYGLWPDLTLAFFNSGWSMFAAQNGGEAAISQRWPLGRSVLEAVAEPLQGFFDENYRRCLAENRPWEHTYECSSPELYRKFHMTAYPLGTAEGILVVNSLRVEVAHGREFFAAVEEQYRRPDGIITQCCHCRRIRRARAEQVWDWVPEWVRSQPSQVSHGICEPCFGFHFSEARMDADDLIDPFSTAV